MCRGGCKILHRQVRTSYQWKLGQKAKKSFGTFSVPSPVKSAGSDKELVLQPDGITRPGTCICKGRGEAEIS